MRSGTPRPPAHRPPPLAPPPPRQPPPNPPRAPAPSPGLPPPQGGEGGGWGGEGREWGPTVGRERETGLAGLPMRCSFVESASRGPFGVGSGSENQKTQNVLRPDIDPSLPPFPSPPLAPRAPHAVCPPPIPASHSYFELSGCTHASQLQIQNEIHKSMSKTLNRNRHG